MSMSTAMASPLGKPLWSSFPLVSTSSHARPESLQKRLTILLLAIGLGVFLSFLPRLYDVCITSSRIKHGRVIEPEDKLFGFYLAAPILATGLWWFAFTVPPLAKEVSAWASIASLALFGFAVVEFDCVLSGYLTDVYATYAASANAPMAFLRAVMSGTFPLFGTYMFRVRTFIWTSLCNNIC